MLKELEERGVSVSFLTLVFPESASETLQEETDYQQLPNCYNNDLALTEANSLFFKCSGFFKI